MRIYLAGGVSGNLKPAWKTMARKYKTDSEGFLEALQDENFWRGGESRHWIHMTSPVKENENISSRKHNLSPVYRSDAIRGGFSVNEDLSSITTYANEIQLAGKESSQYESLIGREGYDPIIKEHRPYILESFYYVDKDTERLLPYFGDFLLDSGAFTFMQNAKSHVVWEEYLERYADFISRNKIEKFFELDIDSVVGYEKVLQYRKKLENLTGRQSIPVWHSTRGIEEFRRSCDEYPYVSLGGIVGNEWKRKQESMIPWFINEAHKRGARIHGLGYTKLTKLHEYHFDSVDSTAWTTGNRFGYIYRFNGKTMTKKDVPRGKRLGDPRKAALINYTEWIKFQKWAENHL